MKYNIVLSIIVVVIFFVGLFFLGFKNLDTLKDSSAKLLAESKSLADFQEKTPEVEEALKTSFYYKHEAADVYGATLNAFGNGIVGNYQFYKGPDGSTRAFAHGFDGSANINSVLELNEVCKSIGVPLVFVKYPYRTNDEAESEFSGFSEFRKEVDRIYNTAAAAGVDILDFQDGGYFSSGELESFYLKTDGHPNPQVEFLAAKYICEYLNSDYGIKFPLFNQTFDKSNYTINSYPFMGNYSRNSGHFFSSMDTFDIMHPKFETDMELVINDNNRQRKGTYEEVCMNGYEQKEDLNEYTYFITNFLQYSKACYDIFNNNVEDPKILFIADSMLLSSMSYIALTTDNITIIDPRQGTNKYLVANALAYDDYDAVIVGGNSSNFFRAEFHSRVSMPDIEERIVTGKIGHYGILTEYCNSQKQSSRTQITFDPNVKIFHLTGWAVDPDKEDALGSMYVLVGDKVLMCDYGTNSSAPSDYYKNKKYQKSGFKVSFSTSLLYDDNDKLYDSISIVCVSKDRKYKYKPVVFPLIPQS